MLNRLYWLNLFAAAFLVWALLCYNPFLLWFQNDDFIHILLCRKGVLFQQDFFRPVCDVYRILEYHVWGINAAGYHITNLVLHCFCTYLVFCFSKQIVPQCYTTSGGAWVSRVAALLFFAYPFHSESVFWILGDTAILGTIFPLIFLMFFCKENKSMVDIFIYSLAFALSLLTYESSWVLPITALVLIFMLTQGRPPIKKYSLHFVFLGAIFIVYLFFKNKVTRKIMGDYEGGNFLHFDVRVLLLNFFKLVSSSFTSYMSGYLWLTGAFVLALAAIVFLFVKNRGQFFKGLHYMLICFVISILPYVSLGINTHGTEGGRYLYMPSVFVCIAIAMAVFQIRHSAARFAILVSILVIYSVQLTVNARNYRFAGRVVRQITTELGKLPPGKNINVYEAPQSQYGALIFRTGLPDAVEFLPMNKKNLSINVVSLRDQLLPLKMPYKTTYLPLDKDSVNIRYVFTDSALVIYH